MKILMITGAGISTGSGLDTYRGKDGRYTELEAELGMPVEVLLSPKTLKENPALIWSYWIKHMPVMRAAEPSLAHKAIVELSLLADEFLEVTQNVDGLSRKAGIAEDKLIELHGSYHRFSCTNCKRACHPIIEASTPVPPLCFICKPDSGAVIRPDVVMFGELIKDEHYFRILDFIKGVDMLIISGTTLQFHYLSTFIASVAEQGGRIVYIDPHASPYKNVFLVADSALEVPEKVEAIRLTADEGLVDMVKTVSLLKQKTTQNL